MGHPASHGPARRLGPLPRLRMPQGPGRPCRRRGPGLLAHRLHQRLPAQRAAAPGPLQQLGVAGPAGRVAARKHGPVRVARVRLQAHRALARRALLARRRRAQRHRPHGRRVAGHMQHHAACCRPGSQQRQRRSLLCLKGHAGSRRYASGAYRPHCMSFWQQSLGLKHMQHNTVWQCVSMCNKLCGASSANGYFSRAKLAATHRGSMQGAPVRMAWRGTPPTSSACGRFTSKRALRTQSPITPER